MQLKDVAVGMSNARLQMPLCRCCVAERTECVMPSMHAGQADCMRVHVGRGRRTVAAYPAKQLCH